MWTRRRFLAAALLRCTAHARWVLAACCWHWLIENRLRTSMTQERLVNLAIMSIESEILREIDFTTIIIDFAAAKSRKVSGL